MRNTQKLGFAVCVLALWATGGAAMAGMEEGLGVGDPQWEHGGRCGSGSVPAFLRLLLPTCRSTASTIRSLRS